MKKISILLLIIFGALSISAQQVVYPTYTVTANETWDINTYPDGILIQQHLTIENGGFLIISPDVIVKFSYQAKVLINIGGKLYINGATLKSNSLVQAWQGIIVRGNPNYNFYDFSKQGLLVIDNNSVVDGAFKGIWFDDGTNTNTGGAPGIIKNTTFRNCGHAVYIGSSPNGLSSISNCNIIVDDDCYNYFTVPNSVPAGIISFDTKTRVSNCLFDCQMTNPSTSGLPAILAKGGDVRVTNCTFNKWNEGVRGESFDPTNHLEAKNNVFTQNTWWSISLIGQTNSLLLRNEINVGNKHFTAGALFLDANNYLFEENDINNNTNNQFALGLWVENSGNNINIFYKNSFSNLWAGSRSIDNLRTENGDGLIFKCNIFENNRYDILDWGPQGYGLGKYQGSYENEPDAAAGNQFSWMGMSNSDIANYGEHFFYIYHNQSNLNHKPEDYTLSTVTAQPNTGDNAGYDEELSCASNFDAPGGGISIPIDTMISRLQSARIRVSEIDILISQLTDNSDTEGLKTEVQTTQLSQSYELYLDLLSTSPYLSNEVIEEAMYKESVINNAMLRDIMVANTHSAKDDELLESLDYRATPMPDYMKAEIWQGKDFSSALEVLRSRRSFYSQQESRYYNLLKYHYMSDTVNESSSRSSLINLLEDAERIGARYHLAFTYLGQEEYALADDVLDNIPIAFTLNAKEYEEYITMVDYYGIRKEMQLNEQSIGAANSQQLDALLDLANNGYGLARSYACNVLSLYDLCDFELPDDPENKSLYGIDDEYNLMKNLLSSHQSLTIAPNPARNYVTVHYSIGGLLENPHVQILTPEGRIVKQIVLNKAEDQKIIDVSDLKPGIYMLNIINRVKVVDNGKFIIVK